MNYNKNVESSIKYLKSKIPHIIYGVKSSLDSFSDTFLDIHNTVIKLNKDRKLEKSSIEKLNTDSFYMNKIFNINPIALLASTGDANRFTSFFDNYFKIIEKFEESQDPIDYYNEDLGISTPRLMNFDISLMASEMTLLNSPSLNEEKVPKIAIKSLENAEISKFLRKIIYDDTIKAECYHEFLLGQIDISSLSSMIVKIYYDTMFSKEFKDSVDIFSVTKYLNNSFMSSGLTTFVNNPSFSFNKESYVFNIFNNDIYGAFIFLNHIIQSNDNFATMDIGDSTIDKIENFISDIRSLIEKRVDKLINRTIVSAIITYLAKVELSKNYTYLDLNYGFIKELIQVTKEEINEVKSECFNHGLDDHIHNHMKGEILQKRIFDFVSLIANLHSAGKINSLNYNEFLRFIERIIPEIYSNETYLTNSINKEINIDLIDLAEKAAKTYITEFSFEYVIKELTKSIGDEYSSDINKDGVFFSNKDLIKKFALRQKSDKISIENHKVLAKLYRINLHLILKLFFNFKSYKQTKAKYLKHKIFHITEDLKNGFSNLNDFKFMGSNEGLWNFYSSMIYELPKWHKTKNYILEEEILEMYQKLFMRGIINTFKYNEELSIKIKRYDDTLLHLDEILFEFDLDNDILHFINKTIHSGLSEYGLNLNSMEESLNKLEKIKNETLNNYSYKYSTEDLMNKMIKYSKSKKHSLNTIVGYILSNTSMKNRKSDEYDSKKFDKMFYDITFSSAL